MHDNYTYRFEGLKRCMTNFTYEKCSRFRRLLSHPPTPSPSHPIQPNFFHLCHTGNEMFISYSLFSMGEICFNGKATVAMFNSFKYWLYFLERTLAGIPSTNVTHYEYTRISWRMLPVWPLFICLIYILHSFDHS